ncbi:DNA polymerase IV [Simiduia agarivorans]|uniref:DNA polymerase IV n=1 Tax=Simiduia agarivorans (strain DSM 21679 / JCM 13881 / BCRC 17597 / SA1) TaxID=1117647 RepID=K4KI79_SIMAS|nr:DNA polymerase IV [Simiduia agarivorans]AFU98854.2 DNA polymerase iv, devoid of proofreading, damage-inducible protein p [Simiduia agarivorans SA1 = DSM 21679]
MSDKPSVRKIIHIDADCFYAALELRDHPELVGKAIAVGGSASGRGVISTCNYEARRFGIHSAMPTATALRLCPHLVLMPHRFQVYKQASKDMHEIFSHYASVIEPLSLDEAYLDVSDSGLLSGSGTLIAEAIRKEVRAAVGITVSAGVAPNKFLAKVASDWNKPDGLCVIKPAQVAGFVAGLPVSKIFGVGRVTAAKMQSLGLHQCKDLQARSEMELVSHFGSFGSRLYSLCRGIDHRPVAATRTRKSMSVEHTYATDLIGRDACLERVPDLLIELDQRMQKIESGLFISGCFVKVKFSDFSVTTLARAGIKPGACLYKSLFSEALDRHNLPVRLLGIGVKLAPRQGDAGAQLALF